MDLLNTLGVSSNTHFNILPSTLALFTAWIAVEASYQSDNRVIVSVPTRPSGTHQQDTIALSC